MRRANNPARAPSDSHLAFQGVTLLFATVSSIKISLLQKASVYNSKIAI
jgi:hypothetical protein